MPGNPNPDTPKSGKKVQFQNSPEKLENGLSTFKSTPEDPYVDFITIQIQRTAKIHRKNGFWKFPLMGPNLFWKFKILKKALLRPAGPGIRKSPGPEKRCRTCGAVFELLQILNSNLDFGTPGTLTLTRKKKRKKLSNSEFT